ncbi:hypothetical protein BS47DRAFT_1338731 [Hydnum rufescens UP504]|uniref:Uncharacterized protein n=1 Tax=Hydnum rufescens UP504 TaxID=1448309 RepID=A0A9P6E0Q6_9AGAM|nr:hypothetical protein BS47DRAFT_1338731 [Hydnum rufescens UP504]
MASIFESFAQYPFSSDPVFQSGLATIIQPLAGKPEQEVNEVIGRAKAFYFSKTAGVDIKWEDYLRYREQHPPPQSGTDHDDRPETQIHTRAAADLVHNSPRSTNAVPSSASSAGVDGAPAPLSFAKLADLIGSGQLHLIPNNDIIPNGLNTAEPSLSRAQVRRKPWETGQQDTQQQTAELTV